MWPHQEPSYVQLSACSRFCVRQVASMAAGLSLILARRLHAATWGGAGVVNRDHEASLGRWLWLWQS